MAIVFTNVGRTLSASYLVGKINQTEELTLRLYSNDYDPNFASVSDQFEEVSEINGYTSQTLDASDWFINDGLAEHSTKVWNFTGSVGNVYGYYATVSSGEVVFAERFSNGPYNIASSGDIIRVTINFSTGQN